MVAVIGLTVWRQSENVLIGAAAAAVAGGATLVAVSLPAPKRPDERA